MAVICLSYWSHAEGHYVKYGEPTSEIDCYRSCLCILRELYGTIPAKDFGPLALKAVRAKMVELGWARTNVNTMIGRIRRVFKFAVENEQLDAEVLHRLQAVAPLLAGRTEAHDNAPRHAVDQDKIEAVRVRVQPMVRDLIDLQLATGSPSGELRYLSADPAKTLFDIGRTAYCRTVTRACEKAGIERWAPHWLRHTFVTRVREQHGIEATQALAGHSAIEMTQHYSSRLDALAIQTAATCG